MKLVCLGDSLTYGYGVRSSHTWCNIVENETGIEVVNRGVNGDTTSQMLDRLKSDVLTEKPNIVHIMGGTNDVLFTGDIIGAINNITLIVENLLSEGIYPIISTPIPIHVELVPDSWCQINRKNNIGPLLEEYCNNIRKFSDIYKINMIDCYSYFATKKYLKRKNEYYIDGIHLTSEGNKVLSEIFIEKLEEILTSF